MWKNGNCHGCVGKNGVIVGGGVLTWTKEIHGQWEKIEYQRVTGFLDGQMGATALVCGIVRRYTTTIKF